MTQNKSRNGIFRRVNSDWLEALLKETGMTQAELARAANLDQGLLSRIRRGMTKPTAETLQAIARATKMPVEEIYQRAGLLKPRSLSDRIRLRFLEDLQDMPDSDIQELRDYIQLLKNRHKRK